MNEQENDWNWEKMFESLFSPRVSFYRRTVIDKRIMVSTGTVEGSGVYVVIIIFNNESYALDRILVKSPDELDDVQLYHSQIVEEILCGANTFDYIADPHFPIGEEPRAEVTLDIGEIDELDVIELSGEDRAADYVINYSEVD